MIGDDPDAEPSMETELTKPEAAKTKVTEEETEELESDAKTPEALNLPKLKKLLRKRRR